MADSFSFEEFAKDLLPPAVAVLKEEGFDTLSALLSANANDIESLQMKRGHTALVRETVKKLQEKHRQGPLFAAAGRELTQDTGPDETGQPASEQPRSLFRAETPMGIPGMEIRVMLLGRTGTGKKSLGNTLLGYNYFQSSAGLRSGTQKCHWAEACIDGIKLNVIDTSGLLDTHRNEEEIVRELGKSVALACPGPHVIIIVIRCGRRYTMEDHQAVKTLEELFGLSVRPYLMVVFTGGDSLRVPVDGMQQALEQLLENAGANLKEVLDNANNRFCVVENTGSYDNRNFHRQVVFNRIQTVVQENNGTYFTNEMVQGYNQKVQRNILRLLTTRQLPQEEAIRQTRKSIVEEEFLLFNRDQDPLRVLSQCSVL